MPEETYYGLLMLSQTYEFKLLPNTAQVETFDSWLRICAGVWNHALAERRDFARARKSLRHALFAAGHLDPRATAPRQRNRDRCRH